ncbi:MAG: divalent metal cation transporter, partial [Planctomycetales bacterium]|nr:divalent metal cation transporter [Planctomycetales bacterium]
GWGLREMANGLLDARVGSVIMALITIMLMSTAGAALRGVEIQTAKDIAQGLTIFGSMGHAVFCIGLFSAAYSSFLVNSMIGGFILSDNLGLGSKPSDMVPRLATVAVLLIGMGVALYTISSGSKPMAAIVAGQAATVLASPLVAGTLLWLCNRRDVMGEHVNGWALNIGGGMGFLMLLAMAAYTAIFKVWPAIAG